MSKSNLKTWCFFDLDGTIILKDSYLPYLFGWLLGHPGRIFQLITLPLHVIYYLLARKERSYIKEKFLGAFMRGARREDVDAFSRLFWDRFLPRYRNESVIDRLRWHKDEGHIIYIITASFDFYCHHLEKLLPVSGVIATRAEWNGNVLTGKIAGENCRGEEKVRRTENELGVNLSTIYYYAYTDSESDIPLLRNADRAMMVKSSEIIPWKNRSS